MTGTPRIFGITAGAARSAVILRRGPSDWGHVGVWDFTTDEYTSGAWFRGTIYPQKCDVSPDGRWLVYSAMKHQSDWESGFIYEAVSRVPWVAALASWAAGTTYTRGLHFTTGADDPGPPDTGDAGPLLSRFGLAWTPPIQFAVERRRGWSESADTPSREAGGPWDERRQVTMIKPEPDGSRELWVEGRYAAFRTGEPQRNEAVYSLVAGDEIDILGDAQWAEWDDNGDLLMATWQGKLLRIAGGESIEVADLAALEPDPQPAPAWASEW